jgi:hypothetical protein
VLLSLQGQLPLWYLLVQEVMSQVMYRVLFRQLQ